MHQKAEPANHPDKACDKASDKAFHKRGSQPPTLGETSDQVGSVLDTSWGRAHSA